MIWGHVFICVRPFYERAVSDLDRSMHISLWVWVAHSSFIGGLHTTKNTASGPNEIMFTLHWHFQVYWSFCQKCCTTNVNIKKLIHIFYKIVSDIIFCSKIFRFYSYHFQILWSWITLIFSLICIILFFDYDTYRGTVL